MLDGCERRGALRGSQARTLLTFLVLERHRAVDRYDLADALWGERPPAAAGEALRALLTNLRGAIGRERLVGREELRLSLPASVWIDFEAAARAIHDAESAVALSQWTRAWIASHIAMNVASRPLLPRIERPWLDERRAWLRQVRVRALEALAASGLELGGPELVTCRRAAGELVAAEPFRESGHRLLMQALEREGNTAQALVVFERLRTKLRDELGAVPDAATLELHRRLLASGDAAGG